MGGLFSFGGSQYLWKYVISHNLHRRHLTTSQRAMVAIKLATLKHGDTLKKGDKSPEVLNDTAVADAARQLNVGRATTAREKSVMEHGSKSVKEAVEQGVLSVSLAAQFVKAVPDKKEQTRVLSEGVEAVKKASANNSNR